MKNSILTFMTVGALAAAACAQALNLMPIPAPTLERRAKQLVEAAAQVTDAAVKCVPDETKIAGLHAPGSVGVILIGDQRLSEDAIKKAGKEPTPVGLLFLIDLGLVSNNQPIPADKLRPLTVKDQQGNERKLSLAHLAIVSDGSQQKLQLYGKGKQPLLETPLLAAQGNAPVSLDAKPAEKGARLTLTLAGKFQATLQVAPQTL